MIPEKWRKYWNLHNSNAPCYQFKKELRYWSYLKGFAPLFPIAFVVLIYEFFTTWWNWRVKFMEFLSIIFCLLSLCFYPIALPFFTFLICKRNRKKYKNRQYKIFMGL